MASLFGPGFDSPQLHKQKKPIKTDRFDGFLFVIISQNFMCPGLFFIATPNSFRGNSPNSHPLFV